MRTSVYWSSILASFLFLGLAPVFSVPIANGQSGQTSLILNGTSAYAEAAHAAEVNTTADWTVEAWFKDETPGGYSQARARILNKGDTSVDAVVPYFVSVDTNVLYAVVRCGGTSRVLSYKLLTAGV